jgi:opacity protein-like surface antigen
MKRISKLSIILILFFVGSLYSQNLVKTGTTAAPFLKIGSGARAISMGGAFTATADDISAMYWNPAGLTNIKYNEAMFNHVDYIIDVNYDYAAAATNLSGLGSIGAFVTVLSMDEMAVRTVEQPEGTGEKFQAGALAAGISFARSLTDKFSIGFNAKYVREYIWHESAQAFAVDVGVLYKISIFNEFRLAASISNFGTKMQMEGRDITSLHGVGPGDENLINKDVKLNEYDLPLLFRVGVAADFIKTDDSRLTAAVDAIHPNDHTEYVNSGLEYSWKEIVFLRAGYNSLFELDTEQGLTLGAGVNYGVMGTVDIMIDYAYQDFGRLENVHYFSFGVRF